MARVQTTPAVRVLLAALVAYVFVMLLLILVRFLRIFPLNHQPAKRAAVVYIATPSSLRFAQGRL